MPGKEEGEGKGKEERKRGRGEERRRKGEGPRLPISEVRGHSWILVLIESAYMYNLGPILHRFRDIARFCVHDPTPISP